MHLSDKVLKNIFVTTTFVSEFTTPKLTNDKKKLKPEDIIEEIKVVYHVDINYMKAWHENNHVIAMLRGGLSDSYRQMKRYIYMLNNVYPNLHIAMNKSWDSFMYLFIAVHAMIRCLEFCRPVVVVNDAHLSGPYKGTFLSTDTLNDAGMSNFICLILYQYL